jgi:hypothetical protein
VSTGFIGLILSFDLSIHAVLRNRSQFLHMSSSGGVHDRVSLLFDKGSEVIIRRLDHIEREISCHESCYHSQHPRRTMLESEALMMRNILENYSGIVNGVLSPPMSPPKPENAAFWTDVENASMLLTFLEFAAVAFRCTIHRVSRWRSVLSSCYIIPSQFSWSTRMRFAPTFTFNMPKLFSKKLYGNEVKSLFLRLRQ